MMAVNSKGCDKKCMRHESLRHDLLSYVRHIGVSANISLCRIKFVRFCHLEFINNVCSFDYFNSQSQTLKVFAIMYAILIFSTQDLIKFSE